MSRVILLFCFLLIAGIHQDIDATPRWLELPSTPSLPKPAQTGYALIDGAHIWYATFGEGEPVILLHGGLANSDYWGNQVPLLAKHYKVIVMDSRGHGRSTNNEQPYSYDLMASDVVSLMDFLQIKQAAIVGWSDGAIIGLDIAIHHPERLTKLFAFAANSDPNGEADTSNSVVFKDYIVRTKNEYKKFSPSPNGYADFYTQIAKMWTSQPHFSKLQLNAIYIPVWIVDGDHDEAVKRENTEWMATQIPNAGLLIQPSVSHFSFLQDPEQFNQDILRFLRISPESSTGKINLW